MICFLLFLISAPLIILYSQGYRIDSENKKIVKTGGVYLKIIPKGAMVSIDEKIKRKTDFLSGGIFIGNLIPKKYFLKIEKVGYQFWKKELEIIEEKVIEAKNIFLIPHNLKFEFLERDVNQFFFSPNEKSVILKKEILNKEQKTWILTIYDTETKIKSRLIEEKEISKEGVKFLNLNWSPDSQKIILKAEIMKESENEIKFFILDLKKTPVEIIELNLTKETKDCYFHPTSSEKIFFTKQKQDSLLLFEREIGKENGNLLLEGVIVYDTTKDSIFWISEQGFLEKSDLYGRSQKISIESLSVKENSLEIKVLNSFIFLKQNEKLLLFNEDSRNFKEISAKVKSIKISPDLKKIVLYNDYELSVLFLKEDLNQPQKEKGEKVFLTRFSKKIGDVFWWTSHYLIFNADSEIKIIEIDDRDEIQIWNIADFKEPVLYFSKKEKALYVQSKQDFFISEKMY